MNLINNVICLELLYSWCQIGDQENIDFFLKQYNTNTQKKIFSNNVIMKKCLFNICKSGKLETLWWFCLSYYNQFIIRYDQLYEFGCMSGNIVILQWLNQIMPHLINYNSNDSEDLFQIACKNGYLDIAIWLVNHLHPFDISFHDDRIFRCTCANGYLHIAQWLLTIKPTINIKAKNHFAFRYACANNHLHIAKWLLTIIEPTINRAVLNDAFCLVCENGHFEIAQWLLLNNPQLNVKGKLQRAFQLACQGGHLLIAQWIFSINQPINSIKWKLQIIFLVCENGHLSVLKWLFITWPSIIPLITKDYYYQTQLIISLCIHGHLDILMYLNHIDPFLLLDINYTYYFANECKIGNVHIMEWLYGLQPPCFDLLVFLKIACIYDDKNTAIIKWLFLHLNKNNNNRTNLFKWMNKSVLIKKLLPDSITILSQVYDNNIAINSHHFLFYLAYFNFQQKHCKLSEYHIQYISHYL